VKGDREAFERALGAGWTVGAVDDEEDMLRLTEAPSPQPAPSGRGSAVILKAAVEAGVQVRHLARRRSTLEEMFARLVTEARNGAR
jgi:hypothetical protein